MEMNNHHCHCHGQKRGHQKTGTTTTPTPHDNRNTATSRQRQVTAPNQAFRPTRSMSAGGTFRMADYEAIKIDRLPAAPQTLFKQEQLLGMLEDFARHMHEALMQNDIQVAPSIKLGLNTGGDIRVLGHHPDKGKIESLFNSQSNLTQQFHQIAFTSRLQQLDGLQSDFRGDFFKYPAHSIQQISFVHLRAVRLQPFSMTLEQPGNSASPNPAVDKRLHDVSLNYFHMMISRTNALSAPAPTPQQTASNTPVNNPSIEEPATDKSAQAVPAKDEAHLDETDKKAKRTIAEDHKNRKDDRFPPGLAIAEQQRGDNPHHVHKGKLRCVINS